jgi:hypothetical protein
MTTINDIADLARILREQPEWADTIRSILLGQELLAMPARLAELVEAVQEIRNIVLTKEMLTLPARFDEFVQLTQETHRQVNERLALLEANVERLNVGVERLNGRVGRLEGRFSNFEGSDYERSDYERRVLNRLVFLSRQQCGLVDPYLAFSNHFRPAPDFDSAMARAENDGLVTPEQASDLYNADVIISAPDNRHLLAETSITLGDGDVDRAKRRAAILAAATRGGAIPVVVTAYAEIAQTEYATAQEVVIFSIPYP